ncbi:hypothetical protein KKG41_00705 [Patescibacteria group bacterium]|nr:hypothetical protein [Patescibacteria group bacterium]MBU1890760.1 hypothetical protein [Patescibacteria group bacterium]
MLRQKRVWIPGVLAVIMAVVVVLTIVVGPSLQPTRSDERLLSIDGTYAVTDLETGWTYWSDTENDVVRGEKPGDRDRAFSVNAPTGLDLDRDGNLIVASRDDNKFIRINPRVITFDTIYQGNNGLSPQGVAVGAQTGNIYFVKDDGNFGSRVMVVNANGEGQGTLGQSGWCSKQVQDATQVALNLDESVIYILGNPKTQFVQAYEVERNCHIAQFRTSERPVNFTVDKAGHVFVRQADGNVAEFEKDGYLITMYDASDWEHNFAFEIRRSNRQSLVEASHR